MSALDNDSSPGRPSASRAGPERSDRRRVCDSSFDYVGHDSTHTKRSTVTKRPISMRGVPSDGSVSRLAARFREQVSQDIEIVRPRFALAPLDRSWSQSTDVDG